MLVIFPNCCVLGQKGNETEGGKTQGGTGTRRLKVETGDWLRSAVNDGPDETIGAV